LSPIGCFDLSETGAVGNTAAAGLPVVPEKSFFDVLYARRRFSVAVQILATATFCIAKNRVFEISIQPCKTAWENAFLALIFVRCTVDYCNAVARATVALLGRFLPRLGPLHESGPFFGSRPPVPNRRLKRPGSKDLSSFEVYSAAAAR
jgi:hypothetical protein